MVDCHFWEDEDYYSVIRIDEVDEGDDDDINNADHHDDRRRCMLSSIAFMFS